MYGTDLTNEIKVDNNMKTFKSDLSKDFDRVELYIFADEHIGDPHSNIAYLKERINYVKDTPNCFAILDGDIINNATKTTIGDVYNQKVPPDSQIAMATELFNPIKDKILCITLGNHESHTFKREGIDPMLVIANNLGVTDKYSDTGAYIFLRFGDTGTRHRKQLYTIYVTHGSGSGRKEGSKAIRLADLASITDADIYIHGHTHLPFAMKLDFFKVTENNTSVKPTTKLFVNSSGNLTYGGYGEILSCKPACIDKPTIILEGSKKKMIAIV